MQSAAPLGLASFSGTAKIIKSVRAKSVLHINPNRCNILAYPSSWKLTWTKINQDLFPFRSGFLQESLWTVDVLFSLRLVLQVCFFFFRSWLFENEQTHKDCSEVFTSTCFVAPKTWDCGLNKPLNPHQKQQCIGSLSEKSSLTACFWKCKMGQVCNPGFQPKLKLMMIFECQV